MSNQSGIVAEQELLNILSQSIESQESFVIVTSEISNDSTVVEFKNEFDSIEELQKHLTTKYPLYVFVKNGNSFYDFISYVPDQCPVRAKMLYASTKNTLVRQVGTNNIRKQLMYSEPEEFGKHFEEEAVGMYEKNSSLLTDSERAVFEIEEQQRLMKKSRGHKLVSQTNGVTATLTFNVETHGASIGDVLEESNVIIFGIDLANEEVDIIKHSHVSSPKELELEVSQPSYTIYRNRSLNYFIYSCPSGSKVKERMVYASNRSGFIKYLQEVEGITFVKIIEIGDPDELELSLLTNNKDEIESENPTTTRSKFDRPKGPSRKKRI
ncbi:twinfilin TWF1 NDAI_0A06580 [Naumovozyma dairenensis CBS 421]|uniref:ADF-H domain-containing protein n=1 Tax=Naumovozyma dairenensis (strain ATCC 10597 / BCRC 20456 / CBS 421 / NBRC 0211 / NRRL Y-12639) TaxID=1071378 RepID=G0W4S4_NAUDC|nr:hypothetical protein NDAI_0A06580 [Naumovozyma dairenensis CBS 421]CCD22812.1 hypothetical protein NDAI_0A06580 [Naumovozyma dairenensis CBS 421]